MHVGRQPYGVGDARCPDETQQIGDFKLAAARRPVALRKGFGALFVRRVCPLGRFSSSILTELGRFCDSWITAGAV
jgi:hypothetical protein